MIANTTDWRGGSFNPRTREGRDGSDLPHVAVLLPVSIHAPARGATMHGAWKVSGRRDRPLWRDPVSARADCGRLVVR